jgi:hypothetical protein
MEKYRDFTYIWHLCDIHKYMCMYTCKRFYDNCDRVNKRATDLANNQMAKRPSPNDLHPRLPEERSLGVGKVDLHTALSFINTPCLPSSTHDYKAFHTQNSLSHPGMFSLKMGKSWLHFAPRGSPAELGSKPHHSQDSCGFGFISGQGTRLWQTKELTHFLRNNEKIWKAI